MPHRLYALSLQRGCACGEDWVCFPSPHPGCENWGLKKLALGGRRL